MISEAEISDWLDQKAAELNVPVVELMVCNTLEDIEDELAARWPAHPLEDIKAAFRAAADAWEASASEGAV